MAIAKRLRFEIFKRDEFTCRYCGRKSPETILELDHIIPKSKNGNDDEINLVTSCFDCNRGKSDKNLSDLITGEDPHDKALELAERERQMQEYNEVRKYVEKRVENDLQEINEYVSSNGYISDAIRPALYKYSKFDVKQAIQIAINKKGRHTSDCVPYFWGVLRNITGVEKIKAKNNKS